MIHSGSEYEINGNIITYYRHEFAIAEDNDLDDLPDYKEKVTITINNSNFNKDIQKVY